MNRFHRPLLPRLSILLVLLFLAVPCQAQTLHQRSLQLFQSRASKAAPGDYTFVVLGDSREGDPRFRQALKLARSFDPLFVLHGGDYSNKGSERETTAFLQLVARELPDVPLFVVVGNHEDPRVFQRMVGPLNFTLSHRELGLTLISLDNSQEELKPAEQERLQNELGVAKDTVFVAMHIPPKTPRWRSHVFTKGADSLKASLEKSRVQGLFTSHAHLYDRSEFAGVPAFITGGAGASLVWFSRVGERVHHILVVRVKNGQAEYRMVPLP